MYHEFAKLWISMNENHITSPLYHLPGKNKQN